MFVDGKGGKGLFNGVARGSFEKNLPSEAATVVLVKSGHRRRNFEIRNLSEDGGGLLDFGEGGFFGFVSDREAGKMRKRW